MFLGLHDRISEQASVGFLRGAAFDPLPSFGHAIACSAVFPEAFVLCLLSPPIQLLSFTSGRVERIC